MDITLLIFVAFCTSFLITYLSIPSIIKVADQKHLYDEPDEARKFHLKRVPTLGGIAIFGGLIITSSFFVDFKQFPTFGYTLSAIIVLFFTGVKDDIIPLTALKKLIAQIIASLIVVIKCDVRLSNLYGFLWIDEINYPISVLISVFTLLVIINSFNLIDGINGLAGGVGLIVSITFGYLFFEMNHPNLSIIAFSLAGALLGFLQYNLRTHAKIFMGDTGSLTVGLISSIFCIEFIEINSDKGFFNPTFAPVFAFAILIIPLFDTLRVFMLRMSKGKSPLSADRNHLHHFILDLGFQHWQTSAILYLINLFFIGLAWSLEGLPTGVTLIAILAMATLLSVILSFLRHKKMEARKALILQTSILETNHNIALNGSHTSKKHLKEEQLKKVFD
jgi:UDP-GlcNAc:undecaprenyl-phosphate/decaprenyl-phosphate GlcNAc-1-phosphate transferase